MDALYDILEWVRRNWLVTITVTYMIGVMLYCHRKGFIHTVLGICAAVISVLLTGVISQKLMGLMSAAIGDSAGANLVVRVLCLVVVFLLIRHVMGLIIKASDAVMGLPVLRGLDQVAGAVAGLLFATVFVWLIGSVIVLCGDQGWTAPLNDQIKASSFLTWLHEHNVILSFFRELTIF